MTSLSDKTNIIGSSGYKKLSSNKYIFVAIQLLVVVGIVLLIRQVYMNHKHNQVVSNYDQSVALTQKKDYKAAAQELVNSYNSETKQSAKANYAFNIGMDYYFGKDPANGKKWLQTAEDIYKQSGDNASAQIVAQTITQQEASISQQTIQQSEQNAKSRNNVQDSNL